MKKKKKQNQKKNQKKNYRRHDLKIEKGWALLKHPQDKARQDNASYKRCTIHLEQPPIELSTYPTQPYPTVSNPI